MTQRLKGVLVTFDRDIREDDAEAILTAIRMVRGVADVSPVEADSNDWMARQRVRSEISEEFRKMWEFISTGKRPAP